ncbi:MAG: hypothetical protein ACLFQJ_10780 [Campylobacterales bacterium]
MRYLVVILALGGVFFTGCEKVQKGLKDKQAEWMGLDRTVSLYSLDGKLVKEYEGDINVDTTVQGRIYFILDNGKSVMTNMPYIVEEK